MLMKSKHLLTIVLVTVLVITVLPATELQAASKAKVTFNANGGKIGKAKTKVVKLTKGKKIGKLPVVKKRTGYTFKGWYTKKAGGSKVTKNTRIKKNAKFYARWTANSYSVTYDPQNYSGITTKSVKFDTAHYTPVLPGYKFNGWYDATGKLHTKHAVASSVSLTARWQQVDPLAIDLALMNRLGKTLAQIQAEVPGLKYYRKCTVPEGVSYEWYYTEHPPYSDTDYLFKDGVCRYIMADMYSMFQFNTQDRNINDFIKLYGNYTNLRPATTIFTGSLEFKISNVSLLLEPDWSKGNGFVCKTGSYTYISTLSSKDAFYIWDNLY